MLSMESSGQRKKKKKFIFFYIICRPMWIVDVIVDEGRYHFHDFSFARCVLCVLCACGIELKEFCRERCSKKTSLRKPNAFVFMSLNISPEQMPKRYFLFELFSFGKFHHNSKFGEIKERESERKGRKSTLLPTIKKNRGVFP